jgi:hypothetical protein
MIIINEEKKIIGKIVEPSVNGGEPGSLPDITLNSFQSLYKSPFHATFQYHI